MPPIDRRDATIGVGMAMAAVWVGALAAATPSTHDVHDDPDTMYRALRDRPGVDLAIGSATIHVVFADDANGPDRDAVLAWIRRSALAVATYFGRFPIARYDLLVIAGSGAKVGHATTFGYRGSATRVHVGTGTDADAFARDWVLVHEMIHAALPDLPRRALWLQEGQATYIEPIAQAQAGHLPIADVWRQSLIGMPKGEPQPSAGGMDGTDAWGRLYWGGATFWLLAEIAIYERSHGRSSLRAAIRAVNRASGGNVSDWQPEQVMLAGDAATGTDALSTLYARFAESPVDTDLPALFARLGVALDQAGTVVFGERAPLAALRRAITRA